MKHCMLSMLLVNCRHLVNICKTWTLFTIFSVSIAKVERNDQYSEIYIERTINSHQIDRDESNSLLSLLGCCHRCMKLPGCKAYVRHSGVCTYHGCDRFDLDCSFTHHFRGIYVGMASQSRPYCNIDGQDVSIQGDSTQSCAIEEKRTDAYWLEWTHWGEPQPYDTINEIQDRSRECHGPFHGGINCTGTWKEERLKNDFYISETFVDAFNEAHSLCTNLPFSNTNMFLPSVADLTIVKDMEAEKNTMYGFYTGFLRSEGQDFYGWDGEKLSHGDPRFDSGNPTLYAGENCIIYNAQSFDDIQCDGSFYRYACSTGTLAHTYN